MVYLPQPAFKNIMSFLHREYDWERQQVIDELNERCAVLGDDFEFLELVPSLMMPTECMVWNVQRRYMCNQTHLPQF